VPSAILGTNEIAPLTMAAAYAGISNGGVYCSPIAIDRVFVRKSSEELAIPQSLCNQAVAPEIAAAMIVAMKGVVSGGTGAAANTNDGTPLAGKTGTTDDRIHTWMAGFSTEVATAVWVGNVVGLTPQTGKSVNGRAVSTIRHAVWRDLMLEVNKHYEKSEFPRANPRYVGPTLRAVPQVEGFELDIAKMQIITGDLNVKVVETPVSSAQNIGTVAYTVPAFGESVPRGSIIEIYVSSGGQLLMPDVSGLSLQDAYTELEVLGLFPSYPQPSQTWMLNLCNPLLPTGSVHSTIPAAGEAVILASAVIVQPNACG